MTLFENLTVTQVLLLICICIEMFHVTYHDFITRISRPIVVRHQWATMYKNILEGTMGLSEAMQEDPTLNQYIPIETLQVMLRTLQTVGGAKSFRMKLMDFFTLKHIGIYLLLQLVEFAYWVISVVLACMLPNGVGVIMLVVLMVLSLIHSKIERGPIKIKYLYLIDSSICIVMYLLLFLK